MALIKCSECGKEISDKSSVCINCGCPIETKEDKIFCVECGNELNNNDTICNKCGCPIDENNSNEENKNLIKCDTCGKEISVNAKVCPNCGNPIFKNKVANMKKKKWEELTEEEKHKIYIYRKQIKQWYIGSRALGLVFALLTLFPILIMIFFPFVLLVWPVCLILEFVYLNKSKKEDKIWYEKNIVELYQNEIIK